MILMGDENNTNCESGNCHIDTLINNAEIEIKMNQSENSKKMEWEISYKIPGKYRFLFNIIRHYSGLSLEEFVKNAIEGQFEMYESEIRNAFQLYTKE